MTHFYTPKKKIQLKPRSKPGITTMGLANLSTELTHRARKQAKKRFKRQGNTPSGMKLTFRSWSAITDPIAIPLNVVRNLALIEETALTLYKRKYDNLREGEKTRLFEFLKDNVIKEAKKQVIH